MASTEEGRGVLGEWLGGDEGGGEEGEGGGKGVVEFWEGEWVV